MAGIFYIHTVNSLCTSLYMLIWCDFFGGVCHVVFGAQSQVYFNTLFQNKSLATLRSI